MLRLKKQNRNALVVWALILLTSFLMMSCGTRKVQKSVIRENSTTEQNLTTKQDEIIQQNTKEVVFSKENFKDSTITETIEISPINNEKPAYFNNGGKTINITNAYFKKTSISKITSKNKDQKSNLDNSLSKKTVNNSDYKVFTKTDSKQLDKKIEKTFSYFNLLWLLIPIGLYFGYKKYKDKLWFV